jgi:hypothetical protein
LCFDAGLEDAKRKVDAVGLFHPSAAPSNLGAHGMKQLDRYSTPEDVANWERLRPKVQDRMELHRMLLRGRGIWGWMTTKPHDEGSLSAQVANTGLQERNLLLRKPPVVNFLDIPEELATAIVAEALPVDRARFRAYLSDRPFGIGIISAVSYPQCLALVDDYLESH